MANKYVVPVNGARIRQPERKFAFLPESGANVPLTPFWSRRLAAGDVAEAPRPGEAVKTSTKASAPAKAETKGEAV